MLQIKDGVDCQGIRPELLLAVIVSESAYRRGGYDCVITSLLDGRHSPTSLHYAGSAVDLRTRHVSAEDREPLAQLISESLGIDYDVILEDTHLHIEYQPRRKSP